MINERFVQCFITIGLGLAGGCFDECGFPHDMGGGRAYNLPPAEIEAYAGAGRGLYLGKELS